MGGCQRQCMRLLNLRRERLITYLPKLDSEIHLSTVISRDAFKKLDEISMQQKLRKMRLRAKKRVMVRGKQSNNQSSNVKSGQRLEIVKDVLLTCNGLLLESESCIDDATSDRKEGVREARS